MIRCTFEVTGGSCEGLRRSTAGGTSDFVSEESHDEVLNCSDFRNKSYTDKLWTLFHLMCTATCGYTDCVCVFVCVFWHVRAQGRQRWMNRGYRQTSLMWCLLSSQVRKRSRPRP